MFLACGVLLAGCGESPEDVFKELKSAALSGDSEIIWQRLTPAAKRALADEAAADFPRLGPAFEAGRIDPESTEVYEYLRSLVAEIQGPRLDYIKSLTVEKVTLREDTAVILLKSFGYPPPDVPMTLIKSGGKWLWDAAEVLEAYKKHKHPPLY